MPEESKSRVSQMKMAKLQKPPLNECPYCGEELTGYGASSPGKIWRRHRRKHYEWGHEEP